MMHIVNKRPQETADISSARGTAFKELWQLVLSAVVLLIVVYFSVGLVVDMIVSGISFETEAKIFEPFKLKDTKPKDSEKQRDLEKVQGILNDLRIHEKVPPLQYNLVLVDQVEPNAFAFPGGTIGVTTGLLDILDDKIAIAFVIGHELGHFHNRDHLQGLGRAAGFGIIMTVIFDMGSGAESFGNIVNFVLQRNYSQDREKKADHFGLELVYDIYGKVEGTDRLFQILINENASPEWAYMFSTHPSPKQRILELQNFSRSLKSEE